MKKIFQQLRDHIQEEFNWGYYISVGLFLALMTGLNYFLLPDRTIERWITSHYYGKEICMLYYLAFYGLPYFFAVGAYAWFHKAGHIFRERSFWIKSILAITLLSIDASFYYYQLMLDWAETLAGQYVLRKCLATFISAIAIGLPLWIFWKYFDREQTDSFYGLTWKGFNSKPYLILLLLMIPVVIAASFEASFIDYYPTMKLSIAKRFHDLPVWGTLTLYETLYTIDFLWTELIFRGFLVIGMAAILGKGSILPMASIYAFRHFAKPLAESVSSIFGGYILGVIALRSKNIMGGFLIHAGIALLMEIMAILQHAS